MGEVTSPPRGHEIGHPVHQAVIWISVVALFRSSRGGPAPSPPFLRSPRRGPVPSASSLLSRVSLIPAGTGSGARLGGRAFRWEHLLSVRCCLRRSLSSWGRRLLLWHLRSCLTETRSCWHAWRGLWFAALADTCSCQQVLSSERRQRVHELGNGISRQQVTRGSRSSRGGAGRGLSGGDHG